MYTPAQVEQIRRVIAEVDRAPQSAPNQHAKRRAKAAR